MRIRGITKLQHERLRDFAHKYGKLMTDIKIRRQDGLLHAHIDFDGVMTDISKKLTFRHYLTLDETGFPVGRERTRILIEKKKASD